MRFGDLAIQLGGTAVVYLYPLILLLIFTAPFIAIYVRKKRITLLSGLVSTLIGAALVVLALIGTYWGLVYLQGEAFKSLYGV